VAGNPAKRHHVRFWRCPEGWMPGGHRADWLAAGTFDRAVGFSLFSLQITHKIDADTDNERDHIVATVTAGRADTHVQVLEDFATGYHSRNGGGDTIETDGDLPVVDVGKVVVPAHGNSPGPDVDARRAAWRPVSTAVGCC
ncbi:MAG: LssY C-terminal domain-containing protein, partial [Specibacter sp.]